MSDLRDNLRNAQANLQAAKDALKEAEQVARRAAEGLNQATSSLSAFDGLDKQFSKFRIEALKRGAWEGYPADLQKKRIERLEAQEDAVHAQQAYEILNGQADDARSDVVVAEREVEEAAAAAFCEQVAVVVQQLVEANQRCEFLHGVLRGSCLPFTSPGWERLLQDQRTNVMATFLRQAGLPVGTLQHWREVDVAASNAVYHHRASSGDVDGEARAYWQAFAKTLMHDPDAEAGPLPDQSLISRGLEILPELQRKVA